MTEASGAGHSDTYTVVLASEPTHSVSITVTSGNTAAATVNPSTLTFSTSTWDTAQMVTVTTVDDDVDQSSDRSATISHRATSDDPNYDNISIPPVSATVVDDDRADATLPPPPSPNVPVVRISGGNAITEGGNAVFTLTATPAPTHPITVNVTVVDSGSFAAPGQTGPRSLTIDDDGTARFMVATIDDSMDEPDGGISATVEPGSNYNPDPDNGGATVTVADDDLPEHLPAADLLLSPTGPSSGSASLVAPSGGTISYSIALSSPPVAALTLSDGEEVTVSIRGEGAAITIEPTELTFTSRNWNVPQRVRVTVAATAGGSISLSHGRRGSRGWPRAREQASAGDRSWRA